MFSLALATTVSALAQSHKLTYTGQGFSTRVDKEILYWRKKFDSPSTDVVERMEAVTRLSYWNGVRDGWKLSKQSSRFLLYPFKAK